MRPRNRLIRRAALLLALVPAGCTLGPDFKGVDSFSPAAWFSSPGQKDVVQSQPVAEPVPPDWWASFNDPELTALEERAAKANPDVRVAVIRLAESRAQRGITAANEFPQVNGDAAYTREKLSPRGAVSLLGGGGGMSAATPGGAGVPVSSAIRPFNLWQYGLDSTWELDLWGKVRRAIESADATIDASAEARRDTLLSTLAEVAQDYVQLRDIQTEIRIAEDNRAVMEQDLHLTQQKSAYGLTTELDVANAAAELADVTASIPQLRQREARTIDQLGFLLGEPPRALSAELTTPNAIPPVPPRVPIGLPSELARRRPDILEAEAKLHSATAEIGVAEAAFYPSITLNGSIEIQSTQFNKLGSWGAHTYQAGPSITIPIFEGGRLKSMLELNKAEEEEAAVTYQKTVLNAWQEVDDALVAYDQEQQRDDELRREVSQSHRAVDLARAQYAKGLTDYLNVLTAQRQALSADQQEADSRATIATDLVALYKALGGGWDVPKRAE